ncbi:hypothetical protein [uncultured Eubacterium sp.]|uniref:hypothetical protein n=1 Tax=uncultured Eubacterium sp. TaxID=165185 RepID=UPI0015A7AEC1|nr:hypothetical protein [uncultured Eubacterium sp.]
MKKTFKKLVACLLAVLMVSTALPLSVFAADEEFTSLPIAAGGVVCSDNGRFSNNEMNIVNDQEDSNFSVGFWRYDISSLKAIGATVTTAPLNVTVKSKDGDCQGLTFWYGTNDAAASAVNGSTQFSGVSGANGGHLDRAKSYYGLQEIKTFEAASVTNGTTLTVDIAGAINASIQKGLSYCTIMVTQKQAGGKGKTNGWTDTKLKYDTSQAYQGMKAYYTVSSGTASSSVLDSTMVGLVQQSGAGRLQSNRMNIVDDGQDNSFTVGFWKFDITSLKNMGAQATSALMNVSVNAKDSECMGLSFYRATQGTVNLKNGDNQIASLYGNGERTHQAKAKTYFGLNNSLIQTISADQITASSSVSVDLTSAINAAIAEKQTELVVMVMQTSTGQTGGNNGWTDTWLSNANVSVSCAYNINMDDIGKGVDAVNKAIAIYEAKMASLANSKTGMYKNMPGAYEAYVKACAAVDAAQYGNNAEAAADYDTLAQDLLAKTLRMTEWVDTVTGKYNSKIPSFSNTSESDMQNNYREFYNNILYTEACTSGNSGYSDDGNPAGLAVDFPVAEKLKVQIYYPNTILLHDGSDAGAVVPAVLMARIQANESKQNRYIFRCYPTTSGEATFNKKENECSNNGAFMSLSYTKGDSYSWKGGDVNYLTFSGARGKGNQIGSRSDEVYNSGHIWTQYAAGAFGQRSWWQTYATAYKVDNAGFDYQIKAQDGGGDGLGVLEVADRWVYYGSGDQGKMNAINDTASAFASLDKIKHHIYVVNYKALADLATDSTVRTNLSNVSLYREGGLSTVVSGVQDALTFDVDSITLTSVQDESENGTNKVITKIVHNAQSKPTADKNVNAYKALKTEIATKSKTIYEKKNDNNENYTAESWETFVTAYENAVNTISGFYNKTQNKYGIDTTNAQELYTALKNAREALVLNKQVVDTTVLQYAIDNADTILNNQQYFVDTSVDEVNLQAMVTAAKIAVWGKVDDYGFDPAKIQDNAENRATVERHLNQIVDEVAKAVININTVVVDYGFNLNTAIAAGKSKEKDKDQYGNYNILASAVADAEIYHNNIPKVNARIKNQVDAAITNYVNLVNAIGSAIENLSLSFKLLANGTVANGGHTITNDFPAPNRPSYYNYKWTHVTDKVYFITDSAEYKTTIPTTWTAYNYQTVTDFETVLDSVNVNADKTIASQEISSSSAAGYGWPSDFSMPQDKINTLKGGLGLSVNGAEFKWNNFKVTKRSGASGLGTEADGTVISNDQMDHDFTAVLGTTEGLSKRPGGIMCKGGEATFTNNIEVTLPDTSNKGITAENKPSRVSTRLDSNYLGLYMGLVFMWRHKDPGNVVQTWSGYSYARNLYDLDIGFVNVSTLFRLIDHCESADFLATSSKYTNTSWNNLLNAVANAKADMDYTKMTYEQIVEECDTRYNNVLQARKNLVECASNTKFKEIYEKAQKVYEQQQDLIKPSSLAQFKPVYESAASAYATKYNDINIRDYDYTEQATINELTKTLQAAYDALVFVADFTPVDEAVSELVTGIQDNVYTAASLRTLNDALGKLTYYPMTKDERAGRYTDDKDISSYNMPNITAGIAKEAEDIRTNFASKYLVNATIDTSALDAAKEDLRAKKNDPDAYDQAKITEALNKLTASEKVLVASKYVLAATYTNITEVDNAINDALNGITLKNYNISVDGAPNGTFPYGEEVTITAPNNEKVDWYYACESPSTSTPKKFATSDTEITFVVKGETKLTTKKATSAQTYKVTYVNGINSIPYAVEYVPAGTTINVGKETGTANNYTVPQVAYYDFVDYSVDGASAAADQSVTVNGNTVITANYKAAEAVAGNYKVSVLNIGYFSGKFKFDPTIENLHYNDELSFTKGTENGEGYYGQDLFYDLTCYATGTGVKQTVKVANNGRSYHRYNETTSTKRPPVYAWLEINADDKDAFVQNFKTKKVINTTNQGTNNLSAEMIENINKAKAKVVAYGEDYTFRVSKPNTVIMAIDKAIFDQLSFDEYTFFDAENKFDENGASITTQNELVIQNGKFSMVSTFAVPQGAKMVETGVLYSATTGSKTMFTGNYVLGNVGTANNLIRIKSNYHTEGNQYVCSLTHTKLAGKKVSEVPMSWVAYMVYEDANHNLNTVYTPVTTPSNTTATL